VVAVFLVAGLAACGGDAGGGRYGSSASTTSPASTTASSTDGRSSAPPTSVDVDGVEPDHVEPPDPAAVPVSAVPTSTTRTALPGFGEVVIEVHRTDGRIVEWCLLLAELSEQTQRGLMEVTDPDLGGYDGMLFRFDGEHTGGFYMRNTPLPLEVTYLASDGSIVSIVRMEPCADQDGCPTYEAGGPFERTIEVPVAAGGAASLGLEPGATVVDTGRTCAD
jgi:uncharacterized membrane protein (UPF0127 family)